MGKFEPVSSSIIKKRGRDSKPVVQMLRAAQAVALRT